MINRKLLDARKSGWSDDAIAARAERLVQESIGCEIAGTTHDQFFRIEKGKGQVRIRAARINVRAGDAISCPPEPYETRRNLTNTGKRRLRLYTLYAPPNHADYLAEPPKALADAHEKPAHPPPAPNRLART